MRRAPHLEPRGRRVRQQAARSRSDVVVVVVLPAEEAAALSEAAMQAARAEHLSAVTPRAPVALVRVRGAAQGADVRGAEHVPAPGAASEGLPGAPAISSSPTFFCSSSDADITS